MCKSNSIYKTSLLFTIAFVALTWAKLPPVVVLPFESSVLPASELNAVGDKVSTELVKTIRFTVIERNAITEILKEQGFQQTGCTSSECAIEVGQLLAANYAITGSINKISNKYLIVIRLINIESGSIDKIFDGYSDNIPALLSKTIPSMIKELSITAHEEIKKGIAALIANNPDTALVHFTKAIHLKPDSAALYVTRASIRNTILNAKLNNLINSTAATVNDSSKIRQILNENLSSLFLDIKHSLEIDSLNAYAYLVKARVFNNYQKWNKSFQRNALINYSKAIEIAPNDPQYILERGFYHSEQNDIINAIKDYSSVIQLCLNDKEHPKDIDHSNIIQAYSQRAWCYSFIDNFDAAISDYTKLIEIEDPQTTERGEFSVSSNYRCRGDAYLEKGLYDQAKADHLTCLKLSNKRKETIKQLIAMAWSSKAYDQREKGNFIVALKLHDIAIAFDIKNASSYGARARCNAELRNYDSAISDYSKVIGMADPNKTDMSSAYEARGDMYLAKGAYDLAENDFLNCVSVSNNRETTASLIAFKWNDRGDGEYSFGNYDAAIELYSRAIEFSEMSNRNEKHFYSNRALAYAYNKNFDSAQKDMKRAMELCTEDGSDSTWLLGDRGEMFFILKKYASASSDLKTFLEKHADEARNADFYRTLLKKMEK